MIRSPRVNDPWRLGSKIGRRWTCLSKRSCEGGLILLKLLILFLWNSNYTRGGTGRILQTIILRNCDLVSRRATMKIPTIVNDMIISIAPSAMTRPPSTAGVTNGTSA
jgi:hypothetical protein